jgi:hypothetical protein
VKYNIQKKKRFVEVFISILDRFCIILSEKLLFSVSVSVGIAETTFGRSLTYSFSTFEIDQ